MTRNDPTGHFPPVVILGIPVAPEILALAGGAFTASGLNYQLNLAPNHEQNRQTVSNAIDGLITNIAVEPAKGQHDNRVANLQKRASIDPGESFFVPSGDLPPTWKKGAAMLLAGTVLARELYSKQVTAQSELLGPDWDNTVVFEQVWVDPKPCGGSWQGCPLSARITIGSRNWIGPNTPDMYYGVSAGSNSSDASDLDNNTSAFGGEGDYVDTGWMVYFN